VAEETPPRYCSVCRHELKPEDYLYCPNCGTPLILAAEVPTPEADRAVPVPPQPDAGSPGQPAHQQPAQEQPTQRGWWRRHPILTGGLGIIVVLFVFISVVGSLGGGGGGEESAKGGADQEHNKSTRSFAGSASTDGLIVFRRYLDLELTRSAIFTMYPNGSHIRQITNPPRAGATSFLRGPPMGRRSPSIAGVTRASSDAPRIARGAGFWLSTSTPALRAVSHTAYPMWDGLRRTRLPHPLLIAWETPNPPSHPMVSQ
jgi:hypothetical protein